MCCVFGIESDVAKFLLRFLNEFGPVYGNETLPFVKRDNAQREDSVDIGVIAKKFFTFFICFYYSFVAVE